MIRKQLEGIIEIIESMTTDLIIWIRKRIVLVLIHWRR